MQLRKKMKNEQYLLFIINFINDLFIFLTLHLANYQYFILLKSHSIRFTKGFAQKKYCEHKLNEVIENT